MFPLRHFRSSLKVGHAPSTSSQVWANVSFAAPNQGGPNARLEPEPGKREEGRGLGQGIGKPNPRLASTVSTSTEANVVKLDLAVRYRQDQWGTTETGNKKKLWVMWYTRPQPAGAEHGKIEGRGKCGSHTYGPDLTHQQTLQLLLFLQL